MYFYREEFEAWYLTEFPNNKGFLRKLSNGKYSLEKVDSLYKAFAAGCKANSGI